jgi:hypothetical protein
MDIGLSHLPAEWAPLYPPAAFDGTCAGWLHGGFDRMRKQWNKYHFFKCTQRGLYPDNHRHGCLKFFYQIVR